MLGIERKEKIFLGGGAPRESNKKKRFGFFKASFTTKDFIGACFGFTS